MPVLSPEEIFAVARAAGFTPDQAVTWTAIALAESGGRTDAHAGHGEDSWGLWQVNVEPGVRANNWGDLTDPLVNARAAYEISRRGTYLQPWTVTHEGHRGTDRDYRRHLEEAQAASLQPKAEPGASVAPGGGAEDGPAAATAGADEAPTAAQAFVAAAQRSAGDRYVFGAEAELADPDPDAFDCSELVQWAAAQSGVEITDGASNQYLALERAGALIPVQDAVNTPGALLFSFSSEPQPGGGRPDQAHVAISQGDGSTIEARGRKYGVGSFEASSSRFQYAAVIPGMDAPAPPRYDDIDPGLPPVAADGDSDGLMDAFELYLGSDPTLADTDGDSLPDAFELLRSGSDLTRADSDGDELADDLEYALGTTAGLVDEDGDSLTGLDESRLGTDPTKADTDGDGLDDDLEHAMGSNPLSLDSDGDGVTDGTLAALSE